jgi:hypothetical protein
MLFVNFLVNFVRGLMGVFCLGVFWAIFYAQVMATQHHTSIFGS